MQCLQWDFTEDLSVAVHVASAEEIRFTRAERSVLQTLMSYRGRVWTRTRLLQAVSDVDDAASERSIDFIISRLRRKLRDAARRPRYIETRYGEGYVWIAEPAGLQSSGPARLPTIGVRLSGRSVMSYCDRPHAERAVLERHADAVRVLRLQGFLFFGAASKLVEELRKDIDDDVAYLIIDFRDVIGVDDTAIPALRHLEQLAHTRGLKLVFSSARAVIENRLKPLESPRFDSLDAALEWRETEILAADPAMVPAELTLAGYLADALDDRSIDTVLRHFDVVSAPARTDIIRARSHTTAMYFLERGTIEVLLDVHNAPVRVSRIWPGTLFGEIGFHRGGPRTATVRTLEDCRLVCMNRRAVARLETGHPALALVLHRFLARCSATRLVFYNDLVVDMLRSTLR